MTSEGGWAEAFNLHSQIVFLLKEERDRLASIEADLEEHRQACERAGWPEDLWQQHKELAEWVTEMREMLNG